MLALGPIYEVSLLLALEIAVIIFALPGLEEFHAPARFH